jgi:peroxiredoxin
MQPSPRTSEPVAPEAPRAGRRWGLTLLWITPAIFLVLMVVYGMLTREPADSGDSAPRVGQPVPDFTLPALQGRSVQLSALRGKVVFINVWATWCPPCIEEMPSIQQLYDRFQGRGLEVLTISVDPLGAQVVEPFMREHQLRFPVLLDTKGTIERLYRTAGYPESFIVDKGGRLVEKVIGPRDWAHPQMFAMFERLMAAPLPE